VDSIEYNSLKVSLSADLSKTYVRLKFVLVTNSENSLISVWYSHL
jgi:hypothetical protein